MRCQSRGRGARHSGELPACLKESHRGRGGGGVGGGGQGRNGGDEARRVVEADAHTVPRLVLEAGSFELYLDYTSCLRRLVSAPFDARLKSESVGRWDRSGETTPGSFSQRR